MSGIKIQLINRGRINDIFREKRDTRQQEVSRIFYANSSGVNGKPARHDYKRNYRWQLNQPKSNGGSVGVRAAQPDYLRYGCADFYRLVGNDSRSRRQAAER